MPFLLPFPDVSPNGINQKWNKLRQRCASFKAVSGPTSLDLEHNSYIMTDSPATYTILSQDDNNNPHFGYGHQQLQQPHHHHHHQHNHQQQQQNYPPYHHQPQFFNNHRGGSLFDSSTPPLPRAVASALCSNNNNATSSPSYYKKPPRSSSATAASSKPHNHFYTEATNHDSSHEDDAPMTHEEQLDYDSRSRKMWETKSIDLVLSPTVHVHEIKSGSIRDLHNHSNNNNNNSGSFAWKRNSVPGSESHQHHRRSFTDQRCTSSYDDSENGNDYSGEDSGWESHGRQSSARGSPAAQSNGSGPPPTSSSAAPPAPMMASSSYHNHFSRRPHRHSSTFDYYSSNHALNGDWEFNANRFDEQLNENSRLNLAPHQQQQQHCHNNHNNNSNISNLRPSRNTVHYGDGVRFEKLQYYDDAMELSTSTSSSSKSPIAASRSKNNDKGSLRKKLNFSSETQLATDPDKNESKSKSPKDSASTAASMKFPLLKSFKSASMRLPGQKSSMQEVQQILRNKFNRLQNNLRKRRALSVQEVFNDDDEDGGLDGCGGAMDRRSQSGSTTDLPNTTFYVPSPSSSIRLKGDSSTYIRNSLQDSMEDQNNNIEYHDFNNPHFRLLNGIEEDNSGPVSLPYISAASLDPQPSNLSKRVPSQISLVEGKAVADKPSSGHRSQFSDLSFIRGSRFMNRDSSSSSSIMSKLTRSNSQKATTTTTNGSTTTLAGSENSGSRPNSCKSANGNLQDTPKKTARTKLSALFQNATSSSSAKNSNSVRATSRPATSTVLDTRSTTSAKVSSSPVTSKSPTATTPSDKLISSTPVAPKRQIRSSVKSSPPVITKVTSTAEDRRNSVTSAKAVANKGQVEELKTRNPGTVNESVKSKMRIRIRPRSHSPVKQFKHEASKMAGGIKRESLGLLNNMYNKFVGHQLPPVAAQGTPSKPAGSHSSSSGTTQNGAATNITKKLKRLSLDSSHSPKSLENAYKKIQPPTGTGSTAGNYSTSTTSADKTEGPSNRDRKLKQVT